MFGATGVSVYVRFALLGVVGLVCTCLVWGDVVMVFVWFLNGC